MGRIITPGGLLRRPARRRMVLGGGAAALTYAEEVLADGPLGYWRLEETSGTDIADSSGNGNDGTLGVGTGTAPDLTQEGIQGSAILFDSTVSADTGHISFGSAPWSAIVDGLTLEVWFSTGTTNANRHRLLSRNATGYRITYEAEVGNNWLRFQIASAEITVDINLHDGEWHHIVATYDLETMRLYADSVEVDQLSNTDAIPDNGENLYFGWEDSGIADADRWKGGADEVAIYDHALPDDRILAHYNAGIGA